MYAKFLYYKHFFSDSLFGRKNSPFWNKFCWENKLYYFCALFSCMLSVIEMYVDIRYIALSFNKFVEIFIILMLPSISIIRSMKKRISGKFLIKLLSSLVPIYNFLLTICDFCLLKLTANWQLQKSSEICLNIGRGTIFAGQIREREREREWEREREREREITLIDGNRTGCSYRQIDHKNFGKNNFSLSFFYLSNPNRRLLTNFCLQSPIFIWLLYNVHLALLRVLSFKLPQIQFTITVIAIALLSIQNKLNITLRIRNNETLIWTSTQQPE